jgi:hypothetical protein
MHVSRCDTDHLGLLGNLLWQSGSLTETGFRSTMMTNNLLFYKSQMLDPADDHCPPHPLAPLHAIT